MKTTRFRTVVPYGTIALLFFLASTPMACHAELLADDSFNYSGTALNGQNGGSGWNGAWSRLLDRAGSAADNDLSNDGTSLQYPVPFEAPLIATPSGSRVKTGGKFSAPYQYASTVRSIAQPINLSINGTVRFVSILVRKNDDSPSSLGNIRVEFVQSGDNLTTERIWGLGIDGPTLKPWLGAEGSAIASGPAVVPGDTYLLVAKIVSSALAADQAFLKVFGTGYGTQVPFAEPTTWDVQTTHASNNLTLDRIRIRIDPANTATTPGEVDEIRIGDTWFDTLYSVPEPSSFVLLVMAGLAALVRRQRGR
jgi:hypothetical protein